MKHANQAVWSFASRAIAAAVQMATIVVLARNLSPSAFAHAVAIQTVLVVVTSVNGLGLNRRLSFVRSRNPDDPDDPEQKRIVAQILFYAWVCVAILVAGSLTWALVTWDPAALVLLPAAIWLYCEQLTQTWNGISIADGRAQQLVGSYLARRVPVVIVLVLAAQTDVNLNLALTGGMALGGLLSVAVGFRSAPPWARRLRISRADLMSLREGSDLGIWLSQLGDQIRDLDTTVLTMIAPATAGLYALPARLVRPMGMMSLAVATVAFPVFARRDTMRGRSIALATAVGALPTAALAVVVFIAAPQVPAIVGDAFGASVSVLRILCLTTVLWAPTTILITFVQSRNAQSGTRFGAVLITLNSLMVVTVAAAGAAWGATEAAWASVAVQAVTMIIAAWYVGRMIRNPKPTPARPRPV